MESLKKLSKELPFISELEELKREVDAHRPFPKNLEEKVFQKLRLDWNYHSNAIEGNSFTRGETVSLIMEGITAKGKPLKDALDIKGHNQAIDIVLSWIKEERSLTEADIRALHKLVLGEDFFGPAETTDGLPTRKIIKAGQYKTQPNHVKTPTGEVHYYATPEETPARMQELMNWLHKAMEQDGVSPVVVASLFHHKFVEIHPFDDGNGRMTRLLTNFILLKYGYPVSVIKHETRGAYYAALAQADNGQVIPLISLISETLKHSFEIYLKAIHGEDIVEADDLDKEIELFRKEAGLKSYPTKNRDDIDLMVLLFELISYPYQKLYKISDLFERVDIKLSFSEHFSPITLTRKSLLDFAEFMIALSRAEVDYKEDFQFKISFLNHVSYSKVVEVSQSLLIRFNDNNYSLSFSNTKVVKHYDDSVYDKLYIDFIGKFVKIYLKTIKDYITE